MFNQYQQVQLNKESLVETLRGKTVELRKGQKGVIVEVHELPGVPIGYSVEFFDANGGTVAVTTLEEKDIKPIARRSQKTGREVA